MYAYNAIQSSNKNHSEDDARKRQKGRKIGKFAQKLNNKINLKRQKSNNKEVNLKRKRQIIKLIEKSEKFFNIRTDINY